MNSIQNTKEENSPFMQLLMLVFYAIIGLVAVSILALALIYFQYGGSILKDLSWMTSSNPYYLPAQRMMLTAQQIGLFIVPTVLLAKTEGQKLKVFYGFKRPKAELLFIVLLMMVCAVPVLDWVTQLNQKWYFQKLLKA